jgi:amino acid transporter
VKKTSRSKDVILIRINDQNSNETTTSLKRVLSFRYLFAIALGAVASQTSFVSMLNGAGKGGASFFIAIFIAFIFTLCYVATYLELSLMMPKAGGPGTYAAVAIGPFISIGLVLGGYIAVSVVSGTPELTSVERIVDAVYPGTFSHLGLILLAVFTVLNLMGINIFASVQNILVYSMVVAALVIGITGLNKTDSAVVSLHAMEQQILSTNTSVFSLVILAFWSFAGLEFLCPMIEETKRPQKSIPRAMLFGAFMIAIIYALIAFVGIRQVPAKTLATSVIPHWLLVKKLFGNSAGLVMVIFAITATSCVINTVIASLPRMLYGMAHHKELPSIFKSLHPRWRTPWFSILFLFIATAIPLVLLSDKKDIVLPMIESATTLWLMTYIVAHVNVIILRRKYPTFHRPFRTPLYPLPQIIGIAGMSYILSPSPDMTATVYINAGLIFLGISVYSFFWVKYKMKKPFFTGEPIDKAISD